mmetsp:Transcript_14019/g.42390  ORF Transcript_14019/g.42390 Transcript_14019/m.42390 type:complete len:268 (+) Transcript_14019:2-805(+)
MDAAEDAVCRRARRRRNGPPGKLSEAQQRAAVGAVDDAEVAALAKGLGLAALPQFFARGRRGAIYRAGHVAFKATPAAADEALWLRRCNAFGVGPKLLAVGVSVLAMDFVDGPFIGRFLETATDAAQVRAAVADLVAQCRALDQRLVDKREMARLHRSVLVVGARCVLLDFERACFRDRPSNLTGACQYLGSTWVAGRLRAFGLRVDVPALRTAAAAYKTGHDSRDDAGGGFLDVLAALDLPPVICGDAALLERRRRGAMTGSQRGI